MDERLDAYSLGAFTEHANAVAARFEHRRATFLRRLKIRGAIGLVILLTFPLWFSYVENLDHENSGALSDALWLVVHAVAGLVIVGCIIAYAVMPIFRYRNYTTQIGSSIPGVSGVVQQHVSLKGEIFNQLLAYFGNFTLHNDRKMALKGLRGAPDLPEFDAFSSEDYIVGDLDGVKVEITEAQLAVRRFDGSVPVFRGLMLLLDISEPTLVLRGKFSGQTVVIADRRRELDYVASKYSGFQRMALPDSSFDQHFEAFTTDAEEAKRLISASLLRPLLTLSDTVRNARHQKRPIDDKVAYALVGLAKGVSDLMSISAKAIMQWFTTGSTRIYATRPEFKPVDTAIQQDAQGFMECVHCAFYGDKVLITIPYQHKNLFEPDIIFRPPVHDEDVALVYNLMTMVRGITEAVVGALPKEMV